MSDKFSSQDDNDLIKWINQTSGEYPDDGEESQEEILRNIGTVDENGNFAGHELSGVLSEDSQDEFNDKQETVSTDKINMGSFNDDSRIDDGIYAHAEGEESPKREFQGECFRGDSGEYSKDENPRDGDTYINPDLKDYIEESVKRSRKKGIVFKLMGLLAASLLGAFIALLVSNNLNKNDLSSLPDVEINSSEEMNVENAVAIKSTPSVVAITVKFNSRGGFFGLETTQGQAIGSGVVVSKDGYILTNAHVVTESPEDIKVLFHDNTQEDASVIWKDPTLDLAIIKTKSDNLVPIELANSDDVRVGDKAIAIGNPVGLNLQSTLTSGYISGLNRTIKMEDGSMMDGLFQTDASINSGNSGGALLNKKGQLIGINTAKVSSTDGIGFAIPINIAKTIIKSVMEKGGFTPVMLGISGINLDIYKQYSLDKEIKTDKGVIVMEVSEDGPADRANLKSQDIIVGIDGKTVESMNKLKQLLVEYKPGDSANLKIIRAGIEMDVTVNFIGEKANI